MIITYNHAKYIAAALDSVLCQQTDFPFAIHVIDDCSTDGAQDIILDYAARYPGVVKPFINAKNIGREVTQKNFHRGLRTLDGDYLAILEGDDYWTSPQRLQTHVDFLDANPDFVACAHNALKSYEDGARPDELYLSGPVKAVHDIDDLISLRSFFHASTLTFRNVFRGRIPGYFRSPKSCDIFINIAFAQFGKIHYTPDIWSTYRVHAGGLFSSMSKTRGWIWNIEGFIAYNRFLHFRYFRQFVQTIYRYCDTLLLTGREEDGLSAEKRHHYERVRRRYRALDKAARWLDIGRAHLSPKAKAGASAVKLNLGSGLSKLLDHVNVDIRREVDPDLVIDLERTPWPWPSNYAHEIRLLRSLEHMGADLKTFDAIVAELYRVARPDGRIFISAIHPRHDRFMDDPTCVRRVTPKTFSRFDALAAPPGNHVTRPPPARIDLEVVTQHAVLDEPYDSGLRQGTVSRERAAELLRTGSNVCRETWFELRVHKPPRRHGANAAASKSPPPGVAA